MDIRILFTLTLFGLCVGQEVTSPPQCPQYAEARAYECRRNLENAVLQSKQSGLPFEERLNNTCSAWFTTKTCLEQLIHSCPDDAQAFNRTLHLLLLYSQPCFDDDVKRREQQIDCYLPRLAQVHDCMDDFDETYFAHVIQSNHGDACGSVRTIFDCYLDVAGMIQSDCGAAARAEFEKDNIFPLVTEIRPYVSSHCSLPKQVEAYFTANADGPNADRPSSATNLPVPIVILPIIIITQLRFI